MSANLPLGIFDSGVGGLSVAQAIAELMPEESMVYIADSGFAPYGEKSPQWIARRALQLAQYLAAQPVKALVIACNTATAYGADVIRQHLQIPVIAMEPGVKPAVAASRTGHVAILATQGTLQSPRYLALKQRYGQNHQLIEVACTGWVQLVESGDWYSQAAKDLVNQRLQHPLMKQVDQVVLGCTHYPFLTPLIHPALGEDVTIINTGIAVARQLQQELVRHKIALKSTRPGESLAENVEFSGSFTLLTTGDLSQLIPLMDKLWPQKRLNQAAFLSLDPEDLET